MREELSEYCIFTILAEWRLATFEKGGGKGVWHIGSKWKTGKRLFNEATSLKRRLPVLFADAAHDTGRLIYWALLTKVLPDDSGTRYGFERLKQITGRRTQDLILKSLNRKISSNYIRAYAICKKPTWLK